MRKGFKVILIIAVCFIAAAVIAFFAAFAVSGFRFENMFPWHRAQDQGREVQLDIEDSINSVEIKTTADDVILKKASGAKTHIEYTEREKAPYDISVKNGTLYITQQDQEIDWKNINEFLPNILSELENAIEYESSQIVIYLPDQIYTDLTIANVSGKIVSEDTFSFENAAIAGVSGNITIRNMSIQDSIAAAAVSGRIELEKVTTSKAAFSTVSGEVSLTGCAFKKITVETTSGAVSLILTEAENLEVTTTSGDVYGQVLAEQDFHCTTVSGEVSVPGGGTNPWYIETVSGDILFTK